MVALQVNLKLLGHAGGRCEGVADSLTKAGFTLQNKLHGRQDLQFGRGMV